MTTYPDVTPDWQIPLLKGNLTNDWRALNDAYLAVDEAISEATRDATFTGATLLDPIIRDELRFGPEGPAPPDSFLRRTGAGALRTAGARPSLEFLGDGGTTPGRLGQFYNLATYLTENARYDGTNWLLDATAYDGVGLTLFAEASQPILSLTRYPAGANPVTATGQTLFKISRKGDWTVGVTQPMLPWHDQRNAIQLGGGASLAGVVGLAGLYLSDNWYFHSSAQDIGLRDAPSARLLMAGNGTVGIQNAPAPAVGSGGALIYTTRLYVDANGMTSLAPNAGTTGLYVGGAPGRIEIGRTGQGFHADTSTNGVEVYGFTGPMMYFAPIAAFDRAATLGRATAAWARVYTNQVSAISSLLIDTPTNVVIATGSAGFIHPNNDNWTNLGHPSYRYGTVYAATGAINTSARAAKEHLGDLDPADALAAVLATPIHRFRFKMPAPSVRIPKRPGPGGAIDTAALRQAATLFLAGRPQIEAAATQYGFYADEASPLFVTGKNQASATNSLGVVIASIQELATQQAALDARLRTLEGGV